MNDNSKLPEEVKTPAIIKASAERSVKQLKYFRRLNQQIAPLILGEDSLNDECKEQYIRLSEFTDLIFTKALSLVKIHSEIEVILYKPDNSKSH